MKATILDTKKLTILIADDHPSIRYGLKSILEDETYIDCVLEANCGTRVMEIMKTRYVDIIFMDVAMDYGDGITTTAQITKQFPQY